MNSIRTLNADEIDVRQDRKKDGKVYLLLYKNARCDMAIMDETFGPMNWQRSHEFKDGKNYCAVSVWDADKSQWIKKEDIGTESSAEAEKGEASDSFKRACVNWGVGRELYTAPVISVPETNVNPWTRWSVGKIEYNDKREISSLQIVDNSNITVFDWKANTPKAYKPILCERCTHPIKGITGTDGKWHNPEEIAESSRKHFQRTLCYECMKYVNTETKNGEIEE